jgi:hypothetical protein
MDARDVYTVVVGKPEKWKHFGFVGVHKWIIRN